MPNILRNCWRQFELSLRPIGGEEPSRLYRLAINLWIGFAIAVSVKMALSPHDHNNYVVFEAGSRGWWANESIYHMSHLDFRYGPPFAVAMLPLALLPSRIGAVIWIWLNLVSCLWAVRILVRDILPGRWTVDRQGAFLLLLLAGTYRVFWSAQANMLVFALVVGAMQAILQRRWTVAAFLLTLPIYIKLWPFAVAALLIACWPRRLAIPFDCAIVGVAIVPFLTKPWSYVVEQYSDWCSAFANKMQGRHDYRDAWTVWELVQKPVNELGYLGLQLTTALLVFSLVIWQKRRGVADAQLMTFILGVWTAWQLLFGPGTERATFGLIAPMMAWALLTSFAEKFGRAAMLTAFVLATLATIGQFERSLMHGFPFVQAAHPLAVVIFAVWLVAYASRKFGSHGDKRTSNALLAGPMPRPASLHSSWA